MEVLEPNQELLEETIRFMADKECIALTIDDPVNRTEEGFYEEPPALLVNASQGNFVVTAILDEDVIFNLVGDPDAAGTTDIIIGGQLTEYPKKYIVSVEQTLDASLEYFNTGTINPESGKWEQEF
jgi:hypothetical protein